MQLAPAPCACTCTGERGGRCWSLWGWVRAWRTDQATGGASGGTGAAHSPLRQGDSTLAQRLHWRCSSTAACIKLPCLSLESRCRWHARGTAPRRIWCHRNTLTGGSRGQAGRGGHAGGQLQAGVLPEQTMSCGCCVVPSRGVDAGGGDAPLTVAVAAGGPPRTRWAGNQPSSRKASKPRPTGHWPRGRSRLSCRTNGTACDA